MQRWLPWAALGAVWFLWGSTFLAIRVAVATMPPLGMAGVRYVIAGALLAAIVYAVQRTTIPPLGRAQWIGVLRNGMLLIAIGIGGLCIAETQLPAGIAALLGTMVPIWMVVIGALYEKTRIATLAWLGMLLGTLGIVALARVPGVAVPLVPTLIIVVGSFTWAFGSVVSRHEKDAHDHPLVPALEMFVGGVVLLVASAVRGEFAAVHVAAIAPLSWWGLAWLIGPGAILGYSAYMYAVRTLPTNTVATYAYVNPIVAVALGAWLLHEKITANVIVGGLLLIAAVVAILRSRAVRTENRQPTGSR